MKNYVMTSLLFVCLSFALHISADAQTAEEYFRRGQKLAQENKLFEAVKSYKQAIRSNPQEVIYYRSRADAYEKMRLYDDAADDYTRAVKLRPDDDVLIVRRAKVYMSQRKFYWAVKEFDSAIRLNPSNAEYYNLRESAYRAIKKAKSNRRPMSRYSIK